MALTITKGIYLYKEILKNTFASVFEKKDILFKALIIPTLLLMIFDYFLDADLKTWYLAVPFFILSFAINITISITTHRILLLEENDIPTWGLFKFTKREFNFLLSSIGLVLLITIPTFILVFASGFIESVLGAETIAIAVVGIGAIVLLVFVIAVISRLSMVFPSIALDKVLSFKEAWKYTKGYKMLCFITIIIFPGLFSIIFGLVYGLVIGFLMKVISPQLDILYTVLNVFINVFMISALSNTYKHVILANPDFIETKEKSSKITKLSINDYDPIELEENHEITFERLKDDLRAQYEKLGFMLTVVDEIDSWVVKQEEDGESYVALRATEDGFEIQTFNTEEPVLEVLKSD